ncbi:MAG TPA: hypothetical protein VIQ99_07215 [Gammaproteobacteria bacterium]
MRFVTSLSVGLLLAGPLSAQENTSIHIAPITFQNEELIERAIITDCDLPNVQLAELQRATSGTSVTLAPQLNDAGKILEIQIVNAVAGGNAFTGHQKGVTLVGKLFENDREVASFSAMRSSGGGAFGGFKGSCAVLNRCAETLAKDVATWLRKPTPGARLGELK